MNRLTFDDNLTDLNKAIHILTKGKAMQKLAVIFTHSFSYFLDLCKTG